MSVFLDDSVQRIELGNDWVDVRQNISFEEAASIWDGINPENRTEAMKVMKPLLKLVLKDWSFQDDAGVKVEATSAMVDKLGSRIMFALAGKLTAIYFPEAEKKSA